MKVVFCNGPPHAGKDEVGKIINRRFKEAYILKFASALKLATHALYSVPVNRLSRDSYEHCKDDPHEDFFGLTPRQAYIEVSERMVKPLHGADFFGRVLARHVRHLKPVAEIVIITDSGFVEEARPVIAEVGAANCLLLRLHRPECDFKGDSRGYIDLEPPVATVDIHNHLSLGAFESVVVAAVTEWLAFLRGLG